LISEEEMSRAGAVLEEISEVELSTPVLHFSGLLSNGTVSTIFVGAGRVQSDVASIHARARGMVGKLQLFDGKPLEDDSPYGVGLSVGLAELLDIAVDSSAIVVSPTVEGRINALDVQVFHLFRSPVEVLDDKLVEAPLALVRELLDTRGADRLVVLLSDTRHTWDAAARLQEKLSEAGLDLEVRTWDVLSTMYERVRRMFDVIFLFLFVIVLVVASMSVVNTINMAVLERTREIGTLRALGMRGSRILGLFAVESGILGALGSLVGAVLTVSCWVGVEAAKPTWVPPVIGREVPIEVHLVPEHMAMSFAFLLALSMGAAFFPARRAVKRGIVWALGHA
jgi:putative ABC transport system permease protein